MEPVIAVHGGAGGLAPGTDPEREEALREGVRAALRAGQQQLLAGASALDAVEAAVRVLEADPLFNAGRGAVLCADGSVELDAAIMRGQDRACGAVAAVRRIPHPVSLARRLLERGPHVLLAGEGALRFAREQGFALVATEALVTPERLRELRAFAERSGAIPAGPETVGAVARDSRGGLAAATSTGGVLGKAPGRIGDSPIPGAGTWADDAGCAVSATGPGELILRAGLAHEIDALRRLREAPLALACARALARVGALGGAAGCVALAREGPAVSAFDTAAMPRGVAQGRGDPRVALRRGEPQLQELQAA